MVQFNPKEWLLIRDFTKNLEIENPFNEKIIPIKHNIINVCDYVNASNDLVINYEAINVEIPLYSLNALLKDPRIEFKSDLNVEKFEVFEENEEICGTFSPERSDPSMSPTSPRNDSEEVIEVETPVKQTLDLDFLAQLPANQQKLINPSKFDSNQLKKIVRVINVSNDSDSEEESE
jgi:hypothetical protein